MTYRVTVTSKNGKRLRRLSLVWRNKREGKRWTYSAVVGVTECVQEAVEMARPWQMKEVKVMIDSS